MKIGILGTTATIKSQSFEKAIKKLNKNAKIIFTGCATQKNPASFIGKADNSLITGVYSKNEEAMKVGKKIIDELKKLTSDTRRKFLKDIEGNIWEVKITNFIAWHFIDTCL